MLLYPYQSRREEVNLILKSYSSVQFIFGQCQLNCISLELQFSSSIFIIIAKIWQKLSWPQLCQLVLFTHLRFSFNQVLNQDFCVSIQDWVRIDSINS